MKLATIGVGNAGSKLIDQMIEFEFETGRNLCRHALVINTARTDLAKPQHLDEDRRVLIGDTHQKARGHGVGGDAKIGAEVAQTDIDEIRRVFDDVEIHEVDAVLVAAGLGGGTGSGAAPVVIDELQKMYDEPVYGLGVLPGTYEGGRPALNAARSLQSFVNKVDNFIAFDNDAWRSRGQTIEQGYEEMNEELATRIVTLLAAGEVDESEVGENAMDSSDIMRTLDTGGVSSIGYASTDVTPAKEGLLANFKEADDSQGESTDAAKIKGLVRRATNSRLTVPCDVSSADRALIVFAGPPDVISRKGVESAREWLEQEADTVDVLAGDDPRPDSSTLAAVVLLSNVTDTPRINEIQDQAVDAQNKIQEQDAVREEEIQSLITDDDNDLDPIV
ncbi:tubulin/FtsZ family protein [Halorubrum ezzemoulense]|uniref:Tubulin-like protein CetZ n=1 Tax=Halorubrum ezzemoulense TaxID=337243 RepID=A0ABT4Z6V8_HALEZ|nr:tubulin/FtsZ family protein [Halorubrum ezzemoulense]MDB2246441.1 tubulin/FtsZ family protein [Halorubrum ezzemoulense]MDB2280117.1 tubulin/FtsZ family protein [Halorubrum ezzemoulense]MDB2290482.1 tubulin/FtsZ family protein [Halorubrum ezzemoulense]MDB2293911.1 tubulin/FtsZ family protein [Halorubrum ezzemoulense]MDB2298006.1 tubulin/FtsZ family protein [Halorubrum ezzemoulense]